MDASFEKQGVFFGFLHIFLKHLYKFQQGLKGNSKR